MDDTQQDQVKAFIDSLYQDPMFHGAEVAFEAFASNILLHAQRSGVLDRN